MNRAERRRQGIKEKEPVMTMRRSDIEQAKKDATQKAYKTAFALMLSIPVMVIHDKFDLIKDEVVDGKSREERFTDQCLELYDSFNKGYITLDDLMKCLHDETGIRLTKLYE